MIISGAPKTFNREREMHIVRLYIDYIAETTSLKYKLDFDKHPIVNANNISA